MSEFGNSRFAGVDVGSTPNFERNVWNTEVEAHLPAGITDEEANEMFPLAFQYVSNESSESFQEANETSEENPQTQGETNKGYARFDNNLGAKAVKLTTDHL